MDPELVRSLLEKTEDLLGPERKRTEDYFEQLSCIECGESVCPVLDAQQPFLRSGAFNYMAQCTACGCLFSPYSRIIVHLGTQTTLAPERDGRPR